MCGWRLSDVSVVWVRDDGCWGLCCHMDDDCVHSVDVAMNHRIIIRVYVLGVMMMMDYERDGIGMGERVSG